MANPNYLLTDALAATLARLGISQAAITPGSRNTPLAIAFADHPAIPHSVHIDERSAAFFALGAAKSTGRPAVAICTSGTAAAAYSPAVQEAAAARVPLIVITADRPPELRDNAAPQSIDQTHLYGSAPKWRHSLATPGPDLAPYARRVAAQAWNEAMDDPAGPVHLNVPFREPLAPEDRAVPDRRAGRLGPAVEPGLRMPSQSAVETIARLLEGSRPLLVAGPSPHPGDGIIELGRALGAPIFADPLSNLRGRSMEALWAGDTLAAVGALDGDLRPDVVVRFGRPPTSKALGLWQAANPEVPTVVVDVGGWAEPQPIDPMMVRADAEATAAAVAALEPDAVGWVHEWTVAQSAVGEAYTDLPFPSEPAVAATVGDALPTGAHWWVGSSMPIRDVDRFWRGNPEVTAVGNRGANGIDGLLSASLGTAATGRPTYVLAGDLSFLYDVTALVTARRLGVDATIVVVDNGGGGIFHFLPQADHPHYFEELLAVPHGVPLGPLCEALGATHVRPAGGAELEGILGKAPTGIRVVEVPTDRGENVSLHRKLLESVALG